MFSRLSPNKIPFSRLLSRTLTPLKQLRFAQISAKDAVKLQQNGTAHLVDLRDEAEAKRLPLENFQVLPFKYFTNPEKLKSLPKEKDLFLIDRYGERVDRAVPYLKTQGYNVHWIEGGVIDFISAGAAHTLNYDPDDKVAHFAVTFYNMEDNLSSLKYMEDNDPEQIIPKDREGYIPAPMITKEDPYYQW
eukprot:TRINITY_DN1769_c0_g1_i1.p1 TRINITY_DN1769_c0_g1~~TRINITY_DN1769_c0_g1_i1.p1  ORF type:complete len:190 (-),score=34.29 TRINITY_DN1769_c0_g1_i1:128-697(-)